jgi:hypothetical protein
MHPDTYLFLAGERIADLQRDADRRRRTPRAVSGERATIHHREPVGSAGVACTPVTGPRGAG